MVTPSSQIAIAVFGLLVVAAVGALVLPDGAFEFESHQVPDVPDAPDVDGTPEVPEGEVPAAEAPVEIQGLAPGEASRVRIYSPLDARVTLVELSTGPAGMAMEVMGERVAEAPGPGVPILWTGDLVRDDKLGFTLDLPTGAQRVEIDRGTEPATIRLLDLDQTIVAPFVFSGFPTGPDKLGVYNMAEQPPTLLLGYEATPDGMSAVTLPDGTSAKMHSQLVTLEGSPLGPAWSMVVRSTEGVQLFRASVPVAAVHNQIGGVVPAAPTPIDPVLRVVENAALELPSYKAASDGTRTLGPENLTGASFLNGQVPQRIMVDVPEERDVGAPMVLFDVAPPDSVTAQRARMSAETRSDGFVRYVAEAPSEWLATLEDGATVHFGILYRTSVGNAVVQEQLDDNEGEAYRYRVDQILPSTPQMNVDLPSQADPTRLRVSWDAQDGASGVASYRVEKAKLAAAGAEPVWEAWIEATQERSADFTGEAGSTYRFRARATDMVGLVGPFGETQAHTVGNDGSGSATNRAPTVRILNPLGGEAFTGVPTITIVWEASDPDGTKPVINLYMSSDAGVTWAPLASPSGNDYEWDVSRLPAGTDYRVKVEATDGSLVNQDVSGKFAIDNRGLPTADSVGGPNGLNGLQGGSPSPFQPGDGSGEGQGTQTGDGDGAGGIDMTLMLALLGIAAIAGVGAIVVLRLRSR